MQTGSHSSGCVVSRSTYFGMLCLERERKSSKSKFVCNNFVFMHDDFILQDSTLWFASECLQFSAVYHSLKTLMGPLDYGGQLHTTFNIC